MTKEKSDFLIFNKREEKEHLSFLRTSFFSFFYLFFILKIIN
jgi:hypothetical protein